jgi:hypothetical protein
MGGNPSLTSYVDMDTIRPRGTTSKIWYLFDYTKSEVVDGKSIRSLKAQEEFDCSEQTSRTTFRSAHSSSMGDGDATPQLGLSPWAPVPPGTILDTIMKVACKGR